MDQANKKKLPKFFIKCWGSQLLLQTWNGIKTAFLKVHFSKFPRKRIHGAPALLGVFYIPRPPPVYHLMKDAFDVWGDFRRTLGRQGLTINYNESDVIS